MTLIQAIMKSNSWMATRQNDIGYHRRIVVKYFGQAPINPAECRVVRSANDPTVIGKGRLTDRAVRAENWEPVNL